MEFCWNCLHPVTVHGFGAGCEAGERAIGGTLLSFIGCSCALEPDSAAEHPEEGDRCDPSRKYHATPHRGCFLR